MRVAIFCLVAIICMIGSLAYEAPGGPLGFWGFIALWGRELLFLGLGVTALSGWAWARFSKAQRKSDSGQ